MPWATAKVNGIMIAETDFPEIAQGDVYFPLESIELQYFSPNPLEVQRRFNTTLKGKAIHFNLEVNGTKIPDAAWMYVSPVEKLSPIKGYMAFQNFAPLMLKYKKNFHYARSDARSDVSSDTNSICSNLSTPTSSPPTTPTSSYSTPVPFCNPTLYTLKLAQSPCFIPPPIRSKDKLVFGGCLGGSLVNHYYSLHRDRMLSTVPEVDYGATDGAFGMVRISEEA